ISEGKNEVVRQLLERLDTPSVGKIQQQPGGRQGNGVHVSTPDVAAPGTTASMLVPILNLLLPAIYYAFEVGTGQVKCRARINSSVTGIQGKTQYRRAVVGLQGTEVIAQLQGAAGSHLLAQAVGANALLGIPPMARIQPGQPVTAHLFADTNWDARIDPVPAVTSAQLETHVPDSHPGEHRRALVIVASTRAAAGVYEDDAGPQLVEWLESKGYDTQQALVVADHDLATTMEKVVAGDYRPLPDVLITGGGTGASPTDQTVEVISEYIDQLMPNVMTSVLLEGLKSTPSAALSRGIAGLIGTTFVVTLPGSLGGVADGISVLDELIDHIV